MVFFSILLLILTEKSAVTWSGMNSQNYSRLHAEDSWKKNVICQDRALRKVEVNPLLWTCEIPGAQNMIYMKKLRFSSYPGAN